MLRRLFIMTGLLVLTGCSAFLATTQEAYYHSERFTPRRTADTIEVFEGEGPRTPYVVLGRISATQGMFGSRESVLAEIRSRAARMGADAVIEVTETNGRASASDPGPAMTTRYQQHGNVSTSESWNLDPSGAIRLTMTAVAIRYQSPQ